MSDDEILRKAVAEDWIVITNDKDFGELVFRESRTHRGVILLRLKDERALSKITAMSLLLAGYGDRLKDQFAVVTGGSFRTDDDAIITSISVRFAIT